jgi:predicted acetyltransferase
VSLTVRRLEPDEAEVSRRLGWEAFGFPASPPTEPASLDRPGCALFGAFDESGALVAQMTDRDFDSCFGGALVPTSGIAGVTVAAEARGRNALTPLFEATLTHARERGAALSALYPSAPGIYRRFGYELVADFVTVQVPTAALAAVAAPATTTTRRATAADLETVRSVYDRWALEQNGPLSRRGVSFDGTAGKVLEATGVTLAVDAEGTVVGYVTWNRGQSTGEGSVLEVSDLLARTADGYRALLRLLGSFVTVAPITRIDTSGDDLARLVLPSLSWAVRDSSPYMLRVLDVVDALTARRYPPSLRVSLGLRVSGDQVAGTNGGYRLEVQDGSAHCERHEQTATSERTLSPRGLAMLYAGAQSSANLRVSGHLEGGDPAQDLDWDALFGGRQLHIRDYF